MAGYLDELYQLFPNGLNALPPTTSGPAVGLLIETFDDDDVIATKQTNNTSSAELLAEFIFNETLRDVRSDDAKSKASKASGRMENGKLTNSQARQSVKQAAATGTTDSVVHASATPSRSPSDGGYSPDRASRSSSDSSLASLAHDVRQAPGSTASRQASTSSVKGSSASTNKMVAVATLHSSAPTKRVPQHVNRASTSGSSRDAITPPRISISGRSARETGIAGYGRPSPPHADPAHIGITDVFKKITIRGAASAPVANACVNTNAVESMEQRPAAISAVRSGPVSRGPAGRRPFASRIKEERPPPDAWTYSPDDHIVKPIRKSKAPEPERILHEDDIPIQEATFTGFQNGWKKVERRPGDYAGGVSLKDYRPTFEAPGLDAPELPAVKPRHWNEPVEPQDETRGLSGTRITGKGALGSKAGTYKSDSDRRFAAATEALARGGPPVVQQAPPRFKNAPMPVPVDDLVAMDPYNAAWEAQRRSVSGPSNKKNRLLAQAA